MADTIITNSPEGRSGDGGAGWVVALVIVIAIIVGGVLAYRGGWFRAPAPAEEDGMNINVTIPNPTDQNGGNEQPSQNY